MSRVGSHDSDLLRPISSGLLSCRVLPEVSPLPTEVREDGEALAALRRLPSAAAGADQPIAGALRPQVQEGQEELHLQVRSRVFFSQARPQLPTFPSPPWTSSKKFLGPPLTLLLLSLPLPCRRSIYIFSVFIVCSSRKLLPVCLPPNRAFNFHRHNRKCHLLPFDRFSHGAQRQPSVNFTLYEKKGKGAFWRTCLGAPFCFACPQRDTYVSGVIAKFCVFKNLC